MPSVSCNIFSRLWTHMGIVSVGVELAEGIAVGFGRTVLAVLTTKVMALAGQHRQARVKRAVAVRIPVTCFFTVSLQDGIGHLTPSRPPL